VTAAGYFGADAGSIDELFALAATETDRSTVPNAAGVESGVPVYDGARFADADRGLLAEIAAVLLDGAGIVAIRGAMDRALADRATAVFLGIIESERGQSHGDHFAAPGENDRVWNALQKLCHTDPELFCDYYANRVIAAVSLAWLGPGYQITSQVNVVNPGGKAQTPHRDYHLGFMTLEGAMEYPAHVHRLSSMMTLQGAVAHSDMPIESGPTFYVPHSQKLDGGFVAYHRGDFAAAVSEVQVQLPLETGDMVFFNPAVIHGAGHNLTTDVRRMANLLQVGSAFGRSMEAVDRTSMVEVLQPVLAARRAAGADPTEIDRIIAASAEGYPFPADLDVEQPTDGLVPESQALRLRRSLLG
jgi:ectoine hydroxylase-related dioxygenase (phytanoyl-CoA dioxygenase family)